MRTTEASRRRSRRPLRTGIDALLEDPPRWLRGGRVGRASARAFVDAAAPHLLYPPAPEPA